MPRELPRRPSASDLSECSLAWWQKTTNPNLASTTSPPQVAAPGADRRRPAQTTPPSTACSTATSLDLILTQGSRWAKRLLPTEWPPP